MYSNRQQPQQTETERERRRAERAEKRRLFEKLNRDILEKINDAIASSSEQIEELRQDGMSDKEIEQFLSECRREIQIEMIAKFKETLRERVLAKHERRLQQSMAPK